MKNTTEMKLALVLGFALLLPTGAWAEAGKVLFVYGNAWVESAESQRVALNKGSEIDSGDRIVTAANGRVQIRMSDGGLLALRPNTEFLIEHYVNPDRSPAVVAGASAGDEPASFFSLVKGGFRSITGAIGQRDKAAYRVRTPVATIGIRGTDYYAQLCAGDCGSLRTPAGKAPADGLHVKVVEGGVRLVNATGSVEVDAGQFGYVADPAASPEMASGSSSAVVSRAAAVSGTQSDEQATTAAVEAGPEKSPEVAQQATDDAGNPVNLTEGVEEVADASGAVAYATGPLGSAAGIAGSTGAGQAALSVDSDGAVTAFTGDSPIGTARYERDTAQSVNVGRDDARSGATNLSWGRWSTGTIDVTGEDDQVAQSLDSSSAHWVAGPDGAPAPTLPTQGVAAFELVGNTNPTDNRGNVGTLGTANLSADFTDQTVDADVSLSFDQTSEVWDASAQDVDINSADATFGGDFDTVTVTDTGDAGQVTDGTGSLGGFFSGDADGNLTGAGMSYSLSDDAGTDVSGVAAFQVEDGN